MRSRIQMKSSKLSYTRRDVTAGPRIAMSCTSINVSRFPFLRTRTSCDPWCFPVRKLVPACSITICGTETGSGANARTTEATPKLYFGQDSNRKGSGNLLPHTALLINTYVYLDCLKEAAY